jgi:hypothetical protein
MDRVTRKPNSVELKQGTREHRVAMQTLAIVQIRGKLDTFSDLGIEDVWQAYQQRIAEGD